MGFLTVPAIADTVARFMGAFSPPPAKGLLGFPEIPGDTHIVQVPTRHGPVACTVYAPPHRDKDATGVYVNFHGGGFVVPGRRQDDPWCRYLASKAGVYVINVEYDTAPRVRFPVPVEQAHDVSLWAARSEHPWHGRPIAIGGQSAGGNLAAGAARLAWEQGQDHIAFQVLHYPPLDLVTDARRKHSPAKRPVIRGWMRDVFDTAYVPRAADREDRLASPAWGTNGDSLAGIAPAIVATCEFDRLRAEGAAYAEKLKAVGALLAYVEIPQTDHGYNLLTDRGTAERGYGMLAPLISANLAQ